MYQNDAASFFESQLDYIGHVRSKRGLFYEAVYTLKLNKYDSLVETMDYPDNILRPGCRAHTDTTRDVTRYDTRAVQTKSFYLLGLVSVLSLDVFNFGRTAVPLPRS